MSQTYHSFDNLPEDAMLSIQPWGISGTEEELRSVAARCCKINDDCECTICEKGNIQPHDRDTYVFGPALAMERHPGPVWGRSKFSSANLLP